MKKRLVIFLFAATLCMTGVSSITAHAELVNSVGSDAEDESQGVDETQGQKTQYEVTVENVTAGIWKGGLNLNSEVIEDEE